MLASKPRLSATFLKAKLKEWTVSDVGILSDRDVERPKREKPWEKEMFFHSQDVNGKLKITLSNGIYVDSLNLKAAIQNQIRRLAAIRNPLFYKNQAIGMSNYATSQWIYLGKDHLSGYIEIPRGLYDVLIEKVNKAGISCEISDERHCGKHINVSFKEELREEQKPALAEMMKYNTGILQAATAFGKTVVCSAMIAEKQVNILIILDVKTCVDTGRTPIILSKYKNHAEKLYERIKEFADKVFLMTGNHSKREHKMIRERLQETMPDV